MEELLARIIGVFHSIPYDNGGVFEFLARIIGVFHSLWEWRCGRVTSTHYWCLSLYFAVSMCVVAICYALCRKMYSFIET